MVIKLFGKKTMDDEDIFEQLDEYSDLAEDLVIALDKGGLIEILKACPDPLQAFDYAAVT